MTSSSGAKYCAASATERIAASSAAMKTARLFAARAKSAMTKGWLPRATDASVSGDVAALLEGEPEFGPRMRAKSAIQAVQYVP